MHWEAFSFSQRIYLPFFLFPLRIRVGICWTDSEWWIQATHLSPRASRAHTSIIKYDLTSNVYVRQLHEENFLLSFFSACSRYVARRAYCVNGDGFRFKRANCVYSNAITCCRNNIRIMRSISLGSNYSFGAPSSIGPTFNCTSDCRNVAPEGIWHHIRARQLRKNAWKKNMYNIRFNWMCSKYWGT